MNIISLIISLVSGAIGGNVAGAAMKDKSLGVPGNSLSGILGGGIGGVILQLLGMGARQGAGRSTSGRFCKTLPAAAWVAAYCWR